MKRLDLEDRIRWEIGYLERQISEAEERKKISVGDYSKGFEDGIIVTCKIELACFQNMLENGKKTVTA